MKTGQRTLPAWSDAMNGTSDRGPQTPGTWVLLTSSAAITSSGTSSQMRLVQVTVTTTLPRA